jgi:signal transduction histidine kinase
VVPRLAAGISDASARIKTIVSNLKDFARQDRSRGHVPVNVNDAVRAAVAIMNHEVIKATHRFSASFAEGLPPVAGSAQELEQVVVNLLNNALQALPSNRRGVTVATRLDPNAGEVVLEVADEGCGMSPEVLDKIAEPFFSTRMDSGGLGLGLSICRSILKEHGGSLSFESEVGKGTRAIVRLPAIGAGAEPGPAKAATIASIGG